MASRDARLRFSERELPRRARAERAAERPHCALPRADVDTTTTVEEDEFENIPAGDMSALMLAITVGCMRMAQRLLERSADVHGRPRTTVTM